MTYNQVHSYKDIKEKIIEATDIIANPIRETISPRGRNVLFEDEMGLVHSTNDGVTIAKNINVKDSILNAFIEVIRGSALKTNTEVGDGTSTSILLSQILIKEGLKLIDDGHNPMEVKREFEKFGKKIVSKLKAIKADKKDLLRIATISANNDETIGKETVQAVGVAGLDGMVFIEPNNKPETEIIEDRGFMIPAGMFAAELRSGSKFNATYVDVPVLITDKRLYYKEEAETILGTVLEAGHKSVVIVARDFIGESINFFIANHLHGSIKILLVKDPAADGKNNDTLEDLAVYLGGKVISEKSGSLVDNLKIEDFVMASRVYADEVKTLITPKVENTKALKDRIKAIKDELKDGEDKVLKKRLASLTNGMVTIKVGGSTAIEVREKIFRFEDSINATRAAMRDGYLIGGGLALLAAFDPKDYPAEYQSTFKKYCEGNVRQIAENCGEHADTILKQTSPRTHYGYNALTGEMTELDLAGVIDPYKVTEMAINNSISVAVQILSSNYLIVNEQTNESNTRTDSGQNSGREGLPGKKATSN